LPPSESTSHSRHRHRDRAARWCRRSTLTGRPRVEDTVDLRTLLTTSWTARNLPATTSRGVGVSTDRPVGDDRSATARRTLLGVAGLTAIAGGLAATTRPAHGAPAPESGKPGLPVQTARTVSELTGWRSDKLADGSAVLLLGHAEPGDGAHRVVRYDAASTATPNGGTVLAPDDL